MSDTRAPDLELISLGRVGKPHGLAGGFHVTRPKGELIAGIDALLIAGVERKIESRSGTAAAPVLAVAGITSREQLESLRGQDLFVEKKLLPPLEGGEYWNSDLVGLQVGSTEGSSVGEIQDVLNLPSCDVLVVSRPAGDDLLVPLTVDAVPVFEPANNNVQIDLVFLDIDSADEPGETSSDS